MKHTKRLLALLLSLCILCPAALPSALAADLLAGGGAENQETDGSLMPPPEAEPDASATEPDVSGTEPDESVADGEEGGEKPSAPEGLIKIQSIRLPEEKTVPAGTPSDELHLPQALEAVLEDGTTVEIPAVWDFGDYDEASAGTYTITAALDPETLASYLWEPDEALAVVVTVEPEAVLFVSNDPNAEAFAEVRTLWNTYLAGGLTDTSDQDIQAYITKIDNAAQTHYSTLIKEANRTQEPYLLWEDLTMNTGYNGAKVYGAKDTSVPARQEFNTVGSAFERLLDIAEAYSINGCVYYQDADVLSELLSAYDLLNERYYNENSTLYGNWYTWEIGIPQSFLKALLLLGDKVPQEELAKYLTAVSRYVPADNKRGATTGILTSPSTMTGANLLDKAASSAMIAALNPDSERMNQCAADVKTVLKYSNNTNSAINSADDGFWKDGSYIQHEGIAYNGGYGAVLYQQLGVFLHMFHGSPWDFAEAYADSPVFNSIFEGVEPLLYQGHFMDMTAGRGIARQAVNDRNRASGILAALMPYVGAIDRKSVV